MKIKVFQKYYAVKSVKFKLQKNAKKNPTYYFKIFFHYSDYSMR
jgi:hypothetical protein